MSDLHLSLLYKLCPEGDFRKKAKERGEQLGLPESHSKNSPFQESPGQGFHLLSGSWDTALKGLMAKLLSAVD